MSGGALGGGGCLMWRTGSCWGAVEAQGGEWGACRVGEDYRNVVHPGIGGSLLQASKTALLPSLISDSFFSQRSLALKTFPNPPLSSLSLWLLNLNHSLWLSFGRIITGRMMVLWGNDPTFLNLVVLLWVKWFPRRARMILPAFELHPLAENCV